MILVDSSIWIDHFRRVDPELVSLLAARQVVCHPFVVGELACGYLPRRDAVFEAMASLPSLPLVLHDEVLAFIVHHSLIARGIGWVDMHLLASTLVAGQTMLWSRDKRLAHAADACGVAHSPVRH